MRPYLELVGRASNVCLVGQICRMYSIYVSLRYFNQGVYGCAFYQEFIIKSILNLSAAFWHLILLYCLYLVAPTGVGPNTGSFLPLLEAQLEAGTHPVTVGFSTV